MFVFDEYVIKKGIYGWSVSYTDNKYADIMTFDEIQDAIHFVKLLICS